MAKRVQRRRGTTAEHSTFTGYEGETTVDLTKGTVVVHDGSFASGYPLAREDMSNVSGNASGGGVGIAQLNLVDGTVNQVIQTDGSGVISFGTIDVTGAAVGGDLTGTVADAQIIANAVGITEINVTDGTAGQALITNGLGALSFGDVLTDPDLGGHLDGTTSNATINNDTITSAMLTTALKNFTIDEFTGAAAQTTFNLTASVGSVNALLVYIDGIVQPAAAGGGGGYSLPTATSIQFNTAPPVSSIIRCLHLGFQSTVGVPSDGTITEAKIAANAVTAGKFADGSVSTAKIADDAVIDTKIAAQTITEASIVPNTITNISIATGTITGTQIADNAIGGDKIQLTNNVSGDLMYYDGANWVRTAGLTSLGGWNYDISFLAGYDDATVPTDVILNQVYAEMVMSRTGEFDGEVGYIDTQCTGQPLICDVLKNNSSIYTTKPQFPASTSPMTSGTLSTPATFVSGDKITFKITQIGSSTAGAGVRFMLKCKA